MSTILSAFSGQLGANNQQAKQGADPAPNNDAFLQALNAQQPQAADGQAQNFSFTQVNVNITTAETAAPTSEDLESILSQLLEKIIELQLEIIGKNDDEVDAIFGVEGSNKSSAASTLSGLLGEVKSNIEAYIDHITQGQVNQYISENNLTPTQAEYDAAYAEVRRAVSGAELAEQLGLPEGQVATREHYSVAEEVEIRKQQVFDALDRTLGALNNKNA